MWQRLFVIALSLGLCLAGCDTPSTATVTTQLSTAEPTASDMAGTEPAQRSESTATTESTSSSEPLVNGQLTLDHSVDRYPYSGFRDLVIGEEAAYFVYGQLLLLSDPSYTHWRPLCARPDCRHDDASCDALLEDQHLTRLGGQLISLGDRKTADGQLRPAFYSRSLDGSELEALDVPYDSPMHWIAHRGLVYASYSQRDEGVGMSCDTISLKTGAVERREDLDNAFIYAYGKRLLLEQMDEKGEVVYRISDIETRQQREVYRGPQPYGHMLFDTHFDYYLYGDGFYRLDLDTGEARRLREADASSELGLCFYTEDYIVLQNSNQLMDAQGDIEPSKCGLVILNHEAEQLALVPLPTLDGDDAAARGRLQVLTQLGDKLFVYDPVASLRNAPPLFYIELDALERGETVEWQRANVRLP